jgi:SSS family solute:Na+ symporter
VMAYYLPTGMLGLGLTALMASFMSGMAGNVTAFNTVWTYDIYRSYVRPNESDRHYLNTGSGRYRCGGTPQHRNRIHRAGV